MAMLTRSFSGRECWVFEAPSVDDLCGRHAELMTHALGARRPRRLVYMPLREDSRGPFGHSGPPGSHALALCDDCVVITSDPHTASSAPTVRVLPHERVLAISIGEALTLAWLSVRHIDGTTVGAETVLFQATGIELVRAFVRAWLAVHSRATADTNDVVPHAIGVLSPVLRHAIAPLLDDGDRPHSVVVGDEVWIRSGRGRPRNLAAPGALVVTPHAVLLARQEPPDFPGQLVFGVNVDCLPRRLVTGAEAIHLEAAEARAVRVTIRVGRSPSTWDAFADFGPAGDRGGDLSVELLSALEYGKEPS